MMNESETFEGQWYIFGDAEAPAFGPLTFHQEAGLKLIATRYRLAPDFTQSFVNASQYQSPVVIHGVDTKGTPITLFGCNVGQFTWNPAADQVEISPLNALVGGHFQQWVDARFSAIHAGYSLLDAWLLRSSYSVDQAADGYLRATQSPAPDIIASLANGTQISIAMDLASDHDLTCVTFKHQHIIKFKFTSETTTIEAQKYVYSFSRLLSLFTGYPVFVDSISFPQTLLLPAIRLLWPNPGITKARRSLHIHESLVTAAMLGDTLPAAITRWFEYAELMAPVLDLYFSARLNDQLPESVRFLLLAQALEAYHSRSGRFSGESQPRDEFRARRDALVLAAPLEERTWLNEKLHHANQKHLAQKLNELIADQPRCHEFITDTQLFANTVRWTRNYYTHFAQDEENRPQVRIAQGAELTNYSILMQSLLDLLWIRDLNLPANAIDGVVESANATRVIGL